MFSRVKLSMGSFVLFGPVFDPKVADPRQFELQFSPAGVRRVNSLFCFCKRSVSDVFYLQIPRESKVLYISEQCSKLCKIITVI